MFAQVFVSALSIASIAAAPVNSIAEADLEHVPVSLFAGGSSLGPCNNAAYAVTVQSLSFTPYPLVKAQGFSAILQGTSNTPITQGAYADLSVYWGPFKLYEIKQDLCALAASAGKSCPLAANELQTFTISASVPSNALSIAYTVDVNVNNGDNSQLLCLTGGVNVA